MTSPRPLAGLRVLDLTKVLAGPLCTQYLGDLGAEVIKLEPPQGGDDTRRWPPFHEAGSGERDGTVFLSVNRNKRSLALDLKSERGRAVAQDLASKVDVVVESYSTGVVERLGLDYPTLSKINPRLVYCSISGFGRSGPMRDAKGYDLILQAFCGVMAMTGEPGGPPIRTPLSPIDQATGLHAQGGILAALLQRERTGRGAFLEVSLFETALGLLAFNLQRSWRRGTPPEKSGTGHESLCPYQVFQAADGAILIGVANDALWRRFCKAVERPDLEADPRFATNADRVRNRAVTIALVQAIVGAEPIAHWLALMAELGVPAAPVNTALGVLESPQTDARGMVLDYRHPVFGDLRAIAHPVLFDGLERRVDAPPPRLGQHTAEILAELGLSEGAIAGLLRDGVAVASPAAGA